MALRFILLEAGGLFSEDSDQEISEDAILLFMEMLCQWNEMYLRKHPNTPHIYESGIVYKRPEQMAGRVSFEDETRDLNAFRRGEHFRDIPAILENNGGDCLPIETLVADGDGRRIQIGTLKVGDVVLNAGHQSNVLTQTRVSKVWPRSQKSTLTLLLSNGCKLISSADHQHMRVETAGLATVRAKDLRVADVLANGHQGATVSIRGIEPSAPRECVDITTTCGTFWLPESDVITHNCDNVVCWRVAELRNAGCRGVRPYITHRVNTDGSKTYHALVYWPSPKPKGSTEDTSMLLGMGGAAMEKERAEEVRKRTERAQKRGAAIITGISLGHIHPAQVKAAMQRKVRKPL
jgi:hypothetical protein